MVKNFYAGWAESDITPENRVVELDGQYYQRLADGLHSRLKVVALMMQSEKKYSAMISIDNVGIPYDFVKELQMVASSEIPGLKPEDIIINTIHTHSAPSVSIRRNWWKTAKNAISSGEYREIIKGKVVEALKNAKASMKGAGVSINSDFAVIGHCRRVVYSDGTAEMYGSVSRDDFAGLEGGEDSCVEMMFFADDKKIPSGMIVNVACPSQVMEATYKISSDFMGALREKLKKEFGPSFTTLCQISASGCQSPRDLSRNYRSRPDFWHEDGVEEISNRLLEAVRRGWLKAKSKFDFKPALKHSRLALNLPIRRVTYSEYISAKKEIERLEKEMPSEKAFKVFCDEIHANEKIPGRPGPYDDKKRHFAMIRNNEAVVKRYEDQFKEPELTIDLHVLRLGNAVFASNPFELFLEYGHRIKARSKADQTFVIQIANGYEGYLPSPRAEELGGYGGMIINGKIGSDGGFKLVEETLKIINGMF
ncbi:MAG TPA: hypothetical protein PK821_04810 [Victivallales bacterium]|nr:hypothetical protein [Victivallales bacterium]